MSLLILKCASLSCPHSDELGICRAESVKIIRIFIFYHCHTNGMDLKYIVIVTHMSILISNVQAL